MFFREKKVKDRSYLQLVENKRIDGRSQQRVIATIGRLDQLRESGKLADILASGARFSEKTMVLTAHREGSLNEISKLGIGGPLIFERLWKETGCAQVIHEMLEGRKFEFDVERAIFTTVLHRLFDPGSDRACEKWMTGYAIEGTDKLQLQHFYRSMFWLGEPLTNEDNSGEAAHAIRCTKDQIEEKLFQRRRDLYSTMDMVFFDTTAIYFEGEGGETIGQYGHSKDHRPDLKQMVVGAVLDDKGYPVSCEIWPGNMADVSSLIPVTERLKDKFGIEKSCIVADRGMISSGTLAWLENKEHPWQYILGARMRKQKEISIDVLSRAGRYHEVYEKGTNSKSPSPLKVKQVWVEDRRYIICHNEDQAKKDAIDREAILTSLTESLKNGSKSLVGNKGYRKYLKTEGKNFTIDLDKVQDEAKYDGKWVLRTNTDLPSEEVALKYKQLWMVEDLFRSIKSVLETRPIYHKCDETIRGHVFCSFLAMIMMKELKERLASKDYQFEWADIIRDLDNMEEVKLEQHGKSFVLRVGSGGCSSKVFQVAGVAMPPIIRED